MKLGRPEKRGPEIPTCSMADIAFLLIVFFILTTVFMTERGFHVTLPMAVSTKKMPKKNISHIWISEKGAISIDDNMVKMDYVNPIMARKVAVNPNIIVSILMDKKGEYGFLSDMFDQLKEAKTLRVSMSTLQEKG